jgi:hypothetical protein
MKRLVVLLPPLRGEHLRCAQQELKVITAKVDVALSKASLASDAENFLLGEIEILGRR